MLLEVVGDLLAEPGSLLVGGAEVNACAFSGVDDLLEGASENRSKLRVVQDLLLKALKPILSVPKKFCNVCTNALVAQA